MHAGSMIVATTYRKMEGFLVVVLMEMVEWGWWLGGGVVGEGRLCKLSMTDYELCIFLELLASSIWMARVWNPYKFFNLVMIA